MNCKPVPEHRLCGGIPTRRARLGPLQYSVLL